MEHVNLHFASQAAQNLRIVQGAKELYLFCQLFASLFRAYHKLNQSDCHLSFPLKARCICSRHIKIAGKSETGRQRCTKLTLSYMKVHDAHTEVKLDLFE